MLKGSGRLIEQLCVRFGDWKASGSWQPCSAGNTRSIFYFCNFAGSMVD
jgi:hypothetical protein